VYSNQGQTCLFSHLQLSHALPRAMPRAMPQPYTGEHTEGAYETTRMYKFKMILYLHLHTHAYQHSQEDLVWKIVWVSSAKDENLDQVLDEVDVPPDVGINKVQHIFMRVCVDVRGCMLMFFRVCVLCGVLCLCPNLTTPLYFSRCLFCFSSNSPALPPSRTVSYCQIFVYSS